MNLVADVCNQSLDAAGCDFTIGDIEEGTRPAQVLLRHYDQCLRQLLRGAHWDFARKQAPLLLLADATGQTPNIGTIVPIPWTYEYAYPTDSMKVRFVPWNLQGQSSGIPTGNIAMPAAVPIVANLGQPPTNTMRIRPARFTIATDPNYAPPGGSQDWQVQGVSPEGRTVVLTNVKGASAVYTALMHYPSVWDARFRAAMVAYLASEICLPLAKDKKFGMTIRAQQIAIAKDKIEQARISDGNEGFYSSDIPVDWVRTRMTGGAGTGWGYTQGDGPGVFGYGYDSCGFADGSSAY